MSNILPVCYICECFLERNYFLSKYNAHVQYHGENYLTEDLKSMLLSFKIPITELENVLDSLKSERQRRLNLGSNKLERKMKISNDYHRLHGHLYELQESFLHPDFLKLIKYANLPQATGEGLKEKLDSCCKFVWRFPVFTQKFCDEFVEEINNFEDTNLPKGRPNTMNHYGILLDELGFDENFLIPFRMIYMSPIARLLFPEWFGNGLDSHKGFTVAYRETEDIDLAYHFDNAEITINICLGKDFADGELFFGDMRTESTRLISNPQKVEHKVGYGLLHRGQHMHGAMPISGTNSERHNMIIWMRSSSIRNQICPMCDAKPRLLEQLYGGDGFTQVENATFRTEETLDIKNVCSTL